VLKITSSAIQALAFLESLEFREPELDRLSRSGRFSPDFVDYLAGFRFTGEVHAMPEGRVFFADEPILPRDRAAS
jgi:nicotinate phosphoribosyltransferase